MSKNMTEDGIIKKFTIIYTNLYQTPNDIDRLDLNKAKQSIENFIDFICQEKDSFLEYLNQKYSEHSEELEKKFVKINQELTEIISYIEESQNSKNEETTYNKIIEKLKNTIKKIQEQINFIKEIRKQQNHK